MGDGGQKQRTEVADGAQQESGCRQETEDTGDAADGRQHTTDPDDAATYGDLVCDRPREAALTLRMPPNSSTSVSSLVSPTLLRPSGSAQAGVSVCWCEILQGQAGTSVHAERAAESCRPRDTQSSHFNYECLMPDCSKETFVANPGPSSEVRCSGCALCRKRRRSDTCTLRRAWRLCNPGGFHLQRIASPRVAAVNLPLLAKRRIETQLPAVPRRHGPASGSQLRGLSLARESAARHSKHGRS